jgi:FkbM family methyltransferase
VEAPADDAVSVATDVGELWYPGHCKVLTPAVQQAGRWDPEDAAAIRETLTPGMTVLDVGAHVGYFALLAAECVGPTGRVVAVEPSPENFALLAANVDRAGARQVTTVYAAGWRESGELDLYLASENTGDHRVYGGDSARATVRVPAIALDELLLTGDRLDFVLLDTQGSERAVLEGMREAIARFRPVLQVEFWPEGIRAFGDDPAAMTAFYETLGYDLAVLGADEPASSVKDGSELVARAAARPGGFCTLVLTPRQD